jgi:hypothetical protein
MKKELEISSERLVGMCGRCYEPDLPVFPANCKEKPEDMAGNLGMYHCPDCGAMLIAGVPHPPLCVRCLERQHPDFDIPETPTEETV